MRGHAQPDGGTEEVGTQAGSWVRRRWFGVACWASQGGWENQAEGRASLCWRRPGVQVCAELFALDTGETCPLLPPGLNACLCLSSGFFQPSAPVFLFISTLLKITSHILMRLDRFMHLRNHHHIQCLEHFCHLQNSFPFAAHRPAF